MKLYEILKTQTTEIKVPLKVHRFFNNLDTIQIAGDQASFGEDFGYIYELQAAVKWLAEQVGLSVGLTEGEWQEMKENAKISPEDQEKLDKLNKQRKER